MKCNFVSSDPPGSFTCLRCGFTFTAPLAAGRRIVKQCDAVFLGAAPATQADKGLGDTVARWVRPLATWLSLEDCTGCQRRKEWLNRWVPYSAADRIGQSHQDKPAILFRFPHGLGDAVQLTTVLLHLAHLFPEWAIDVASKVGAHSCFQGLARRVFVLGDEPPAEEYQLVRTLAWHEPGETYADSPATKAERALREVFNIQPIRELCRYEIRPTAEHVAAVDQYLQSIGNPSRFAVLHYQGNSATSNKNLPVQPIETLCNYLLAEGITPIILDWDNRSSLLRRPGIYCPNAANPLWGGTGTGDAGAMAAMFARSSLNVGIDSGPGHIMGSVVTPAIIAWTWHHPLHYYGLGDHVTHLVPLKHASLIRGDREQGERYFAANYDSRVYKHLATSLVALAAEKLRQPAVASLAVDGDLWTRQAHRQADWTIVEDVYLRDCYGVARWPFKPATCVDVGAHVGAFARRLRAWSHRTAIACVEANPGNRDCLQRNAAVNRASVYCPTACTYEPGELGLLSTVFADSQNTGGSTVVRKDSPAWREPGPDYQRLTTIETITLEAIRQREGWASIESLKLDCEGSELSILEHADLDGLGVRLIVGEWHDRQRFFELVNRKLAAWKLNVLKDGPLGLFLLTRRGA